MKPHGYIVAALALQPHEIWALLLQEALRPVALGLLMSTVPISLHVALVAMLQLLLEQLLSCSQTSPSQISSHHLEGETWSEWRHGNIQQHPLYSVSSTCHVNISHTQLVSWTKKMFGKRLFNWLMKATVYGQFVAGEDLESIRPTIAKLKASGVRSILDYAVEEDIPDSKEVVMEIRSADK